MCLWWLGLAHVRTVPKALPVLSSDPHELIVTILQMNT